MKKSIYIIDSDLVFIENFSNDLKNEVEFNLVGYSTDTETAFSDLLVLKEIDFLIINPNLSMCDGYVLLKNINLNKEIEIKRIILISSYISEIQFKNFAYFRIDDYLLKPCLNSSIIFHLKQLTNLNENMSKNKEEKEDNLDDKITMLLHDMGIASSLKGFYYIKSAVTKKFLYPKKYMGKTTTSLYPEIANEFNTTGSRVERSIRHAIEIAFSRGSIDLLNKIFGCSISIYKDKPTNSEFISLVADYLRINCKNLVCSK